MTVMSFDNPKLADLDGFRVEFNSVHERADINLDQPPYNIISMPQRGQLRMIFEQLGEDARFRMIVLRAVGEHFSSSGNIKGFMGASPEHVSKLAAEDRRNYKSQGYRDALPADSGRTGDQLGHHRHRN